MRRALVAREPFAYQANAVTTPTANSQFAIRNSQLPDWFTPPRFAVFLLLAFVLAFPGIWMGTETFFRSDYGVMAYPSAHYLRESIHAGELPLWNPLSNCGAPFLAQWGTMCLYPGSLFFVALPMPWSLGVFCLLHLWLGGLGARALAERWTGNRFAAALAGTAFAINGASLACITWPNYCVALGWMPWIVLLTEQAWREGGRKLVLAALAGTMQMLTGVPELVILTWGLLGVMLLGEVFDEGKRQKAKVPKAPPSDPFFLFSFSLFLSGSARSSCSSPHSRRPNSFPSSTSSPTRSATPRIATPAGRCLRGAGRTSSSPSSATSKPRKASGCSKTSNSSPATTSASA